MIYCETKLQAAYIFTKAFSTLAKWQHAMRLIGHVRPDVFWGTKRKPADAITDTSPGNIVGANTAKNANSPGVKHILEFCCEEDSVIGRFAEKEGISVTRITEKKMTQHLRQDSKSNVSSKNKAHTSLEFYTMHRRIQLVLLEQT